MNKASGNHADQATAIMHLDTLLLAGSVLLASSITLQMLKVHGLEIIRGEF